RPPRGRAQPAAVRDVRELPRRAALCGSRVRRRRRRLVRAHGAEGRRGRSRVCPPRVRERGPRLRGRGDAVRASRSGIRRRERDQDRARSSRRGSRDRRPARAVRSLDGDGWQLRGCLGEEWRWHVGPDKPWDAPGWLPARIPGSVLDDLVRAGVVPSPYHERDSLLAEWVPERAWIYRTRFRADAPLLRFDGVDYSCTVFVDGAELATHEGLFAPFDVELRDQADGAEHLLAVVIHHAPASEPQVGRTSRVRVHKPRMNYGWDFCPRLVHQGIWRSVALVDAPRTPPAPASRAVELADHRLAVDGAPVQIKGWNWCPLDPLYGVPRPEKLRRLLTLAKRANVNLLRVWGGGLIESREFYDLCDELGILVWQEFSQSSSGIESVPAADAEFVERLRAEAREIVAELRGHRSLAVWCGGNELDADGSHPAIAALREVVRELD